MKSPISLQTKRICRYIRVSSDKQEGERQLFSTDTWAKFNGLIIDKSFEDTEGSNSRDMAAKRVQFQKMLKACENGDFDAIVVDSLDRFGFKNNKELQHNLYMLDKWGTELWSVSQGCISDDDVATVFNTTAAAITSEKEQKEKGLRNLEGRMRNSRKGNYCGGTPPFGLDVVCYDTEMKEKWRVVYMAEQERLKHNPDGSVEQYNGKNNFPARDANDTLRLSPTIKTERLDAIRKIYQWFADELISYYQISVRLNLEKEEAIKAGGKPWNKGHIQKILANPVYIGVPTDNKKGQSRFYEYKDGKVRPVDQNSDENRVREETDYWRPEKPIFEPIVAVELWDAVQQKLKSRNNKYVGKPNPQRQANFWLQPMMYCDGCGRKMRTTKVRACKMRDGKPIGGILKHVEYYSCLTYGIYGPLNEFGCQNNTVPKQMVEELVGIYLQEAAKKLDFDAVVDNLWKEYDAPLLRAFEKKYDVSVRIAENFKELLRTQISKTEFPEFTSVAEAYGLMDRHNEVESNISEKIKKKQSEFEEIYQTSKTLTGDAKSRANEEMNDVSAEIRRLRSILPPQDRTNKIERTMRDYRRKLEQAYTLLQTGDKSREWTQAVSRVIERIGCSFAPTDKHKKRKTIVKKIKIVPVMLDEELFDIGH